MNTSTNVGADNSSGRDSLGGALRAALQESRNRRVVIRDRSGAKVLDLSLLLALILSVGGPVLPAFVVLGVLVEAINVSFESK